MNITVPRIIWIYAFSLGCVSRRMDGMKPAYLTFKETGRSWQIVFQSGCTIHFPASVLFPLLCILNDPWHSQSLDILIAVQCHYNFNNLFLVFLIHFLSSLGNWQLTCPFCTVEKYSSVWTAVYCSWFINSLSEGHLGYFQVLAINIKLLSIFAYILLGRHRFSAYLVKYLRE